VLPKKWNCKYFSTEEKFLKGKNPKGQTIFLTNFIRGQKKAKMPNEIF